MSHGSPAEFSCDTILGGERRKGHGKAKETALGLRDEADQAKARQQAEDAAELAQSRQNWAAIDSLVREFIPEAVRRQTKPKGLFGKYWIVQSSQSDRQHLRIYKNGAWEFRHDVDSDTVRILAWSGQPEKVGPRGSNPVDGLREGALRLLNS